MQVKLIDRHDLTWAGLALSLLLLFIVSSAFKGELPGGAFAQRVPVLLNYLGGFLAAMVAGAVIVALIAVIKRVRGTPYATFRRDFALAVLFMCIVTYKPVQAAPTEASDSSAWSVSLVDNKLKTS